VPDLRPNSVVKTDSPKYQEARDGLPEELRPIYDELVADYASFTFKAYGAGYVAYKVIAALGLEGWRPSARRK